VKNTILFLLLLCVKLADAQNARGGTVDNITPPVVGVTRAVVVGISKYLEVRPELEFLRTPDFGGLPDDASEDDRKAVANEEYDQGALALEGERIAPDTWWWGTLAGGHRDYLDDGLDPSDLSSRTSFWFVDLSGFGERKLSGRLRLRASGGIRTEFHRLETDDVTSLDLALDLRMAL
jgi:hypothetical protein